MEFATYCTVSYGTSVLGEGIQVCSQKHRTKAQRYDLHGS